MVKLNIFLHLVLLDSLTFAPLPPLNFCFRCHARFHVNVALVICGMKMGFEFLSPIASSLSLASPSWFGTGVSRNYRRRSRKTGGAWSPSHWVVEGRRCMCSQVYGVGVLPLSCFLKKIEEALPPLE